MRAHPLTPLLAPQSIAFVGASERPNTPGHDMLGTVRRSGYRGHVYAVNPKYETIDGFTCYPSVADLPEPVDLAVLAVGNNRLEEAFGRAAEAGARSAVVFASGQREDANDGLIDRLRTIAREAEMPVCGVNCMGFYNDALPVWICGFPSPRTLTPAGGIAFIAQSGSVFGAIAHNDPRFAFNLVVSPGQELVTTAADYMDYALELESTKVVGLFLEAIRDPEAFRRALEKANAREIPVVALKVGRTAESQALAVSHTGALTGSDSAFDALCRRYGVLRVKDVDELAATLLLFAAGRRTAPGGLATIHDSGGERELLVDLAQEVGVPFARIAPATRDRLAERLEAGLEPHNPLDAWGTGNDFQAIFTDCLEALNDDPQTALSVLFADLRDGYYVSDGFAAAAADVAGQTTKPVVVATNYSGVRHDAIALRLTRAGVPVLDGTGPALRAIRHALAWRDFLHSDRCPAPQAPPGARGRWQERLASGKPLAEAEALSLLGDYGVPTVAFLLAESEAEACAAARTCGLPVAVKTAMPETQHKSDVGGVRLGLDSLEDVASAYQDLATRLGPRVIVQRMAPRGVEMTFGMVSDPQFGPVVMVGAGGVFVEILEDVTYALAPFDAATARRLIDELGTRRLLDGVRGAPPCDVEALARTLAAFSALSADLADLVAEMDVNPLIVTADGVLTVDALVVPKQA
jgi:acetate---CoA ligase (ADP-forming)